MTNNNRFLFIILLALLASLIACTGDSTPIVITATTIPATDAPQATETQISPNPTPTQEILGSHSDCFGSQFPDGYFWGSSNPCFNGELRSNGTFSGYENSDGRRQYWYGAEPVPYNRYLGSIGTTPLVGVPAWINAGEYAYRGGMYRALNIEVTEINGQLGVQYGQNFQRGCYDFKLYIRARITQNFNPDNVDVRMEVYTTDGDTTQFNVHSIPNPFGSYEYTWRGYNTSGESGQVLMFAEIRFANMHGSIFVFSAGTLLAPEHTCFDEDGNLAEGVYEF